MGGGPVWPFISVMVDSLFMWRARTSRSLQCGDVEAIASPPISMTVTTGVRKNCQQGRRRVRKTTIHCVCAMHAFCPVCLLHQLMSNRYSDTQRPVFVSRAGTAISESNWARNFRMVAAALGLSSALRISPHSARLSGARHWSRHGCSEKTIMDLGDWKSLDILRRYLGASGVGANLQSQLQQFSDKLEHVPVERTLKFKSIKKKQSVCFALDELAMTVRAAVSSARLSSHHAQISGPTAAAATPLKASETLIVSRHAIQSMQKAHRMNPQSCCRETWKTFCGWKYGQGNCEAMSWEQAEAIGLTRCTKGCFTSQLWNNDMCVESAPLGPTDAADGHQSMRP